MDHATRSEPVKKGLQNVIELVDAIHAKLASNIRVQHTVLATRYTYYVLQSGPPSTHRIVLHRCFPTVATS